jgi:hypothetical protein
MGVLAEFTMKRFGNVLVEGETCPAPIFADDIQITIRQADLRRKPGFSGRPGG